MSGSGEPAGTPGRSAEGVVAVVRASFDALARAGVVSGTAVTEALENAGQALARQAVAGAAAAPAALADRRALAHGLAERPAAPALASATGAALALRIVGRFRRAGFLARRTPAFLVAVAGPALLASASRGAHELRMVASHLVVRAREQGIEPDLERVRRAAVQILSRRPVDPEVEPSHGALALIWLRRAVRGALPFTPRADPEGVAAAAAGVDVTRLGAR